MGFFDKLKQGLQRTKQLLLTDVRDIFRSGEILDEAKLEQFEGRLIRTDMGVAASSLIVDELRTKYLGRTLNLTELWGTVKETILGLLKGSDGTVWDPEQPLSPLKFAEAGPTVILVTGVNGTGKTTSIAKLSKLLTTSGKKVMLAAGDTFRAAAVEQLTMWSSRLGCEIVTRPSGTDPASVAFSGCEEALKSNVDILIIDTAGRLHNQANLMKELEKIRNVIGKKVPGAPHECLLVIDATTGQNGLNQAEHFGKAVETGDLIDVRQQILPLFLRMGVAARATRQRVYLLLIAGVFAACIVDVKHPESIWGVDRLSARVLDPVGESVVTPEGADVEVAVRHVERRLKHPCVLRVGVGESGEGGVLVGVAKGVHFGPRQAEHHAIAHELPGRRPITRRIEKDVEIGDAGDFPGEVRIGVLESLSKRDPGGRLDMLDILGMAAKLVGHGGLWVHEVVHLRHVGIFKIAAEAELILVLPRRE